MSATTHAVLIDARDDGLRTRCARSPDRGFFAEFCGSQRCQDDRPSAPLHHDQHRERAATRAVDGADAAWSRRAFGIHPTVVRGMPRCRSTATLAGLTSARPDARAKVAFGRRRMAERHQNRANRRIDSAKRRPLTRWCSALAGLSSVEF